MGTLLCCCAIATRQARSHTGVTCAHGHTFHTRRAARRATPSNCPKCPSYLGSALPSLNPPSPSPPIAPQVCRVVCLCVHPGGVLGGGQPAAGRLPQCRTRRARLAAPHLAHLARLHAGGRRGPEGDVPLTHPPAHLPTQTNMPAACAACLTASPPRHRAEASKRLAAAPACTP